MTLALSLYVYVYIYIVNADVYSYIDLLLCADCIRPWRESPAILYIYIYMCACDICIKHILLFLAHSRRI